jgi:hypothetical protein
MERALTRIAMEWAIRCFGREHVFDIGIRALRTAEEAIELAQTVHVPKEKLHELVEVVYARPHGRWDQEVGGLLMTVAIMCASRGMQPDRLFLDELCRVLDKSPEHFAARNQEKLDTGLHT